MGRRRSHSARIHDRTAQRRSARFALHRSRASARRAAMKRFEHRSGVLHCEGWSLQAIADAVGTPAYIYSSATLERHYDVFKAAFAPREVLAAFAVKANPNIAVLATLAAKGAGADTVSEGEI